ncbi:MAG: 5'/3'-nucleotidase SurE [Chloroflexota bacterium]
MKSEKRQILLTNDDGIRSPGLWAAAEALSELGYVTVVAPRDQFSGAGRSLPLGSDGIIQVEPIPVKRDTWTAYAVGGTPAQAVLHAVLEIMPRLPDLAVSGINYGENVGSGVTISGTVGAALEAACFEVPALAISLETPQEYHLSYSDKVDFSVAAYFTTHFGRLLLGSHLPLDVDILKVDVPSEATVQTPWELTRLSRKRYYRPQRPLRDTWEQPGSLGYAQEDDPQNYPPDSDVYVLRIKRHISVTPLSIDMTSRVDLKAWEARIKRGEVG